MERAVALKRLEKLFGKKLGWRINPKAPTPEDREAAKSAFPEAVAERKRLSELREARYKAILEADAEYQSLRTLERAAKDRAEELSGLMLGRKITVGVDNGMFFVVKAKGDSWEEVLDKLTTAPVAA